MSRTVSLTLLSVTLFFLLFPLTLGKPGLPSHLKADEAAYYLMARSLAADRDVRLTLEDVDRAFVEFPFKPINNLIVMSDDGWRTVYFGKPYIYSLVAAPFVALFGANGMLLLNLGLTFGMVWLGTLQLARFNDGAMAAFYACGFFLVSSSFAYAFWLQPEVFNMASVMGCLFLALYWLDDRWVGRPWLLALASGAVLALAVYNKPMIAAVGLAPLAAYVRRRRWRDLGAWLAGAFLGAALLSLGGLALTGKPSAYLGVQRQGVTLCAPGTMPIGPAGESAAEVAGRAAAGAMAAAESSPTGNAFSWLFRVPEITLGGLLENIGFFLWGRHTGLLLYLPFAALSVLLFLVYGRFARYRWVLLGSLAAIALYFLTFIHFNWHGGGGFVGNRYFVSVYPAFLFLVGPVLPRWSVAVGWAAGGLTLAPLLFTPFGAGGPEPTLQSHTRNWPLRLFPLELSLRNVPGYHTESYGGVRFRGRRDVFLPHDGKLWLRGASDVEVLVLSAHPIDEMVFEVGRLAPGATLELGLEEASERIEGLGPGERRRVVLAPGEPGKVRTQWGATFYVYALEARASRGALASWTRHYPPAVCPQFAWNDSWEETFYLGAELTYLGRGAGLEADVYGVEWLVGPPPVERGPLEIEAGSAIELPVALRNTSASPWQAEGAARVRLSYHWLDAAGELLVRDGERTDLRLPVAPGERIEVDLAVIAPEAPGEYVLEIDPLFEHVAWFSDRGAEPLRFPVRVTRAPDASGAAGGARAEAVR